MGVAGNHSSTATAKRRGSSATQAAPETASKSPAAISSLALVQAAFKSLARSRSADVDSSAATRAPIERPEVAKQSNSNDEEDSNSSARNNVVVNGQVNESNESDEQDDDDGEELIYEVLLEEAQNLPLVHSLTSPLAGRRTATPLSASAAPTADRPRGSLPSERSFEAAAAQVESGRGGGGGGKRRESLFGALMSAATSSSQLTGAAADRAATSGGGGRSEAQVGVFVRAFKMEPEHEQRQQVGSPDSIAARRATDFIELGLVELSAGSECSVDFNASLARGGGAGDDDDSARDSKDEQTERRVQSSAYKITCRRSEFPLRLTLYQSSGIVGGSSGKPASTSTRYTLGHCVIEPRDWLPADAGRDLHGGVAAASAASGQTASSSKCTILGRRSVQAGTKARDRKSSESVQIEYRLYATLLEAIKSA